jgi:hypothetical protein
MCSITVATRSTNPLAVQHARAADQLNQGDFGIQKHYNGYTDLQMLYSSWRLTRRPLGGNRTVCSR